MPHVTEASTAPSNSSTWFMALTIKSALPDSTSTLNYAESIACRDDRLPLHGQGPFQCLASGAPLFSAQGRHRNAHDLRPRRQSRRRSAKAIRLEERLHRLEAGRQLQGDR